MTHRWESYPLERGDYDADRMLLAMYLEDAFGAAWLPVRVASDRLDVLSGAKVGAPAALVLRPLVVDRESFVGVAIFFGHVNPVAEASMELGGFYVVKTDGDPKRAADHVIMLYAGPPSLAPLVRSKRAAVEALLADSPQSPSTQIADRAGCGRHMVAKMRGVE